MRVNLLQSYFGYAFGAPAGWPVEVKMAGVQWNSDDCGVFTIAHALAFARFGWEGLAVGVNSIPPSCGADGSRQRDVHIAAVNALREMHRGVVNGVLLRDRNRNIDHLGPKASHAGAVQENVEDFFSQKEEVEALDHVDGCGAALEDAAYNDNAALDDPVEAKTTSGWGGRLRQPAARRKRKFLDDSD